MNGNIFAFGLGALLVAAPSFAQAVDPHQPTNNGSAAASMTVAPGDVARGYDPGTRAANQRIGEAPVVENSEARGAYRADVARYDDAVRARHRSIMSSDAHYAHQRRAYAEAMQAWREQVAACHEGDGRACRAPTPDPAAFY